MLEKSYGTHSSELPKSYLVWEVIRMISESLPRILGMPNKVFYEIVSMPFHFDGKLFSISTKVRANSKSLLDYNYTVLYI